jgi:hypothetical protein
VGGSCLHCDSLQSYPDVGLNVLLLSDRFLNALLPSVVITSLYTLNEDDVG